LAVLSRTTPSRRVQRLKIFDFAFSVHDSVFYLFVFALGLGQRTTVCFKSFLCPCFINDGLLMCFLRDIVRRFRLVDPPLDLLTLNISCKFGLLFFDEGFCGPKRIFL
jgi:hypothetical protein